MIVRFKNVKDKHHFVQCFKQVNDVNNVVMKDIVVMDNDIQCVISMRNDNVDYIKMPVQYKNIKYKLVDRNKI